MLLMQKQYKKILKLQVQKQYSYLLIKHMFPISIILQDITYIFSWYLSFSPYLLH